MRIGAPNACPRRPLPDLGAGLSRPAASASDVLGSENTSPPNSRRVRQLPDLEVAPAERAQETFAQSLPPLPSNPCCRRQLPDVGEAPQAAKPKGIFARLMPQPRKRRGTPISSSPRPTKQARSGYMPRKQEGSRRLKQIVQPANPLCRDPVAGLAVPVWQTTLQKTLAQLSAPFARPCEIWSDCTGFNAIGEVAAQLSPWLDLSVLSGSEVNKSIRHFLRQSGLTIAEKMENYIPSPPVKPGSRTLYMSGGPCQPFSRRNSKARGWDDPRSRILKMSVERVTSSNADAALLENSDRLLAVLCLVEMKAWA